MNSMRKDLNWQIQISTEK